MHKIDLKNLDLRTDLVIENNENIINNSYQKDDIIVDDIFLKKKNKLNKKEGEYITISFQDITNYENYQKVLNIFIQELHKILKYLKIKEKDSCLIVGLGNKNVTADSLGSKVLKNIQVTRPLFLLENISSSFRNVSILEPNVIGVTGIESNDLIVGTIEKIKPHFVIFIDSLCAKDIKRLNKTIQITTSGISPGSGLGNNKKELSYETLKIPVIAIGIPTVVDSISIVTNTFEYIMKKISYTKKNIHNNLDKMKLFTKINYLYEEEELEEKEKKEILGLIGLLDEKERRNLIYEVLEPIDANLIVSTKEIDLIIEKISLLISEGLNKTLHKM